MSDRLFTEQRHVTCLCGATSCEMHLGHRDGITYAADADLAREIEHDKAKRRALGVLLARARAWLHGMDR